MDTLSFVSGACPETGMKSYESEVFHLGDVIFDTSIRTLPHKDGLWAVLRNKFKEVLIQLLDTPRKTVANADVWFASCAV